MSSETMQRTSDTSGKGLHLTNDGRKCLTRSPIRISSLNLRIATEKTKRESKSRIVWGACIARSCSLILEQHGSFRRLYLKESSTSSAKLVITVQRGVAEMQHGNLRKTPKHQRCQLGHRQRSLSNIERILPSTVATPLPLRKRDERLREIQSRSVLRTTTSLATLRARRGTKRTADR